MLKNYITLPYKFLKSFKILTENIKNHKIIKYKI